MRQWNRPLPEIVDAYERDDHLFGCVRLERAGEQRCFQFGVDRSAYVVLRKVLQIRPFDQMPGLRHRYFFLPGVQRLDDERANIFIRVARGREDKQVTTEAPIGLIANLMWFFELEDWAAVEHLVVPDPRL